MMIVIVGWGSLIWDPRDLPHEGGWQATGPTLPLEFSRVSQDGRLTLVIDSEHGDDCVTFYGSSPRESVVDAVEDLRCREGTSEPQIGYLSVRSDQHRCRDQAARDVIREWVRERGFDGVVWTDLASNFAEKLDTPFSVDAAAAYLEHLPENAHERAMTYIQFAPAEVSTPLRRRLAEA